MNAHPRTRNIVLASLLSPLSAGAALAEGPRSDYYFSTGALLARASDGQYDSVESYTEGNREYGIIVMGRVRTVGAEAGTLGAEYDLDLEATGKTFSNSASEGRIWDATTDGAFAYAVDFDSGDVLRYRLNFTRPEVLFSLENPEGYRGITYDPSNHSLWLSQWEGSMIENYDMDGNLLSSFDAGHNEITGLALDHTDSALWFGNNNNRGRIRKFNRAGEYLDGYELRIALNGLGGEFDIGEPARITDMQSVRGDVRRGNKKSLKNIDRKRLKVKSELNNDGSRSMVMDVTLQSDATSDNALDVVVESRITEPGGVAKVFLRNRDNDAWDLVGTHAISTVDERFTAYNLDPRPYVDSSGEIKVRICHATFYSSSRGGFKSQINLVQARVR